MHPNIQILTVHSLVGSTHIHLVQICRAPGLQASHHLASPVHYLPVYAHPCPSDCTAIPG